MAAKTKTQTAEEYMKEKVSYHLHKPDGVTDKSRTVTVNGKNYQIQYNKVVMIPRFIAEILDQAQAQDMKTRAMVEEMEVRE